MADVAALRAAHKAGLPDREGREVVVGQNFSSLQAERVDPHVHTVVPSAALERILRLTAGEGAEPCTRGEMSTSHSIAGSVLGAAVGTLLVDGDRLADRVLLDVVEGDSDRSLALRVGLVVPLRRVLGDDFVLDLVDRFVALELALGGDRVDQSLAVRGADLADQPLVDAGGFDLDLLLAGLRCSSSIAGDELLDLGVGDVERVEDLCS